MPAPFSWTDEQIQNMITTYEQGDSVTAIAQRYKTSRQVIAPVLKKHGVVLRSRRETSRVHTCDYNYFRTIDREEKAYWLGFLTTKSCITTGNRLTVCLTPGDYEHLYRLKQALRATQSMCRQKSFCALTICSPEMINDLASHGVFPRKVGATRSAQLPPDLARHYWRGILDGNSSLSLYGLSLTSNTSDLIYNFQAFVLSLCAHAKVSLRRKDNHYQFHISKQTAGLILDMLYEDATIFLPRKYERSRQLFGNFA